MRQLKFRAWQYWYQQFVYFDDLYWFYYHNLHDLSHEYLTIQQFTGIKDCNGVEIYEGDLLDFEVMSAHQKYETFRNQEVVYTENRGMFSFGKDKWSMCDHIRSDSIKVVGNICDGKSQE